MSLVRLVDAEQPELFGGKAVQLGAALRAGLPVPDGFALSWDAVETIAREGGAAVDVGPGHLWPDPCAVRSSAVGEDSADASFAGTHLSVLGVSGDEAVIEAIRVVHQSCSDPGAQAYRSKMGLDANARMGVVIQGLVDADAAGVMFTRDPLTGADQRVIEASWGLGEAVVAGLVTPDRYVLDADGTVIEELVGEKDLAVRRVPAGGTVEEEVDPTLIDLPCLGPAELRALHELAIACDRVFSTTAHDIEFAFRSGSLYLLQRRPITHG
ncbi:MAG TPA: PEP/pyruvate-binding domain-containing protein [Aeromicrobium sp.]|nr:PEP/pyruvate-binding domain-containing protein [Aeromicrobium sp.]